ncbi:hypothetical protein COHA_001301 [Chlorella ohadii]|uniref:Uncharacterized protein n=1 Tax=Chlorella ohadii TaxID=2649997 RepID=A0AAD5DZS4_9CHLO|nr:hypothetical protein COHA_001301 [Chlorella ohadii]
MQQRCSWVVALAAAWLLAALQLAAPTAAAPTAAATGPAVESAYSITALPESCSYLRKDFGSRYFDYTIAWSSSSSFSGCSVEVSRLFIDGACSTYRNNYQDWNCSGGPHGIAVHGSNASCNAVLRASFNVIVHWWTVVRPNAPEMTFFDASAMCATSPIGYFYIHNSCNQTVSFTLTIRTQTLPASPCITLNPVPAPAAAPARRASALPDFSPEGWLFAIFMVGLVWGAATTCGANLGSGFCRAYSSEPTRHPVAAGAVQPAPVPAQAGGAPAGAMHQAPVAHAA